MVFFFGFVDFSSFSSLFSFEMEFFEAAAAYQQGHEVAKKCLGDQHPLTPRGVKSFESFRKDLR